MNPKVRKARRDIERAEKKAAELAAELKRLRESKRKLEDEEIVKRVRAAAKDGDDIDEILDSLPQSQSAFEIAKQSLTKQLAAQRTTRFAVLNAWMAAQERGVDYDINEKIYNALPDLKLEDIVKFADERMARKPRRYMILGNEKELDLPALLQVGPIKRVSLEEIFGY